MTFRQVPNVQFSPNLATTRESMSPGRFFKRILDNFSLGVGLLPPKISKLKRANRCLTQTSYIQPTRRAAEIGCMLFTVTARCSRRATYCRQFHRSVDVRFRAWKFSNFGIFAYFLHAKRLKSTFFVRVLQSRNYTTECFRLFHVVVEGPQGAFC